MKLDYSRLKTFLKTAYHPSAAPGNQKTCVFLLMFDRGAESFILMIQKSDTEGYPWRNQIALPGGHMEADDPSPEHTAFRELEEELGIPKTQVELIGSVGHFETISRKDIEVFVGIWNGRGPVTHHPAEISRVLEVPVSRLIRTHQTRQFHERIPDFYELIYPFEDVEVWGATARILHHVLEIIIQSHRA